MTTPSFNTFRKINYNNPQYQQAMLQRQNASDYTVNPSTRALTDQYTKAEASRIRGLDEFGIANRLAQENLAFNKKIQKGKMNLAFAELEAERQAMEDAKKGRDLGMLIGLAQGGLNMWDQAAESKLHAQQLANQQAEYDRLMAERARYAQGMDMPIGVGEARKPVPTGMIPVLNQLYPVGYYGINPGAFGGYY